MEKDVVVNDQDFRHKVNENKNVTNIILKLAQRQIETIKYDLSKFGGCFPDCFMF